MKNSTAINAKVSREYREKYGWEMPTRRLAKKMYAENKKVFSSVESARSSLRYIENKYGTQKYKTNKDNIIPDRPRNPYALPESDETTFIPYELKATRALFFQDIHAPYHSMGAITTALDFAKKEKPDTLVINGDMFDFYQLSRFMKDPRKRNFAEEMKIGVEILKVFLKVLKCRIILKFGNHDARYNHYIYQRAEALVGFEDFELKTIIQKRLPEVEVLSDKTIISANELTVLHGHEIGTSVFSPVNIARGLFLRGKSNAMCAHHHRTSEHTERTLQGKIIKTWSTGCMCELNPDYLPINNWNHGFAIVDMGKDSGFEVRNYTIYKGKVQ